MNIKKIAKKLSKIRDNTLDTDYISEDDKEDLLSLVHDALVKEHPHLADEARNNIVSFVPSPGNDNTELSTDQKFRLRLMEKTGTGSSSIH
jgi:hypothetical protein